MRRLPSSPAVASICVGASLALAVSAASAAAATVSLTHRSVTVPRAPSITVATTAWTAAAGESNRLTVTAAANGELVLRDAGAPLAAGQGCRPLPDGAVGCGPTTARVHEFVGDAGDGDDTVSLAGPVSTSAEVAGGEGDDRVEATGVRLVADGGPGADVLRGGERNDRLAGGAGSDELRGGEDDDELFDDDGAGPFAADVLDGGPGARDRVMYGERTSGVVVDLAAGTGGAAGEGDALTGIEDASGGDGVDALAGTDGPNRLDGGSGDAGDVLEGRGGDDALHGSGPASAAAGTLRMDGGAGDDELIGFGYSVISGGDGDDHLWGSATGRFRCGAGSDLAEPSGDVVVAVDCDRIEAGEFRLSAVRAGRGRLTVAVRFIGYPQPGTCGVELLARGGGRVLARTAARVPPRRWWLRRLTVRGPLPEPVRLAVGLLRCDRGRRPLPDRQTGRDRVRLASAPAPAAAAH